MLQDVALSMFCRESFSKVRVACLGLLKEILLQAMGSKIANDLDLEKLRDALFMDLIQNGHKLGATGKASRLR